MSDGAENIKDTLKDTIKDTDLPSISNTSLIHLSVGSYTKIKQLISALYMVTDIMDKDEPIRKRLRTLGSLILSDTYFISDSYRTSKPPKSSVILNMDRRTMEIVSLLDISSLVGMVSQMNAGILKKEFFELNRSLKDISETSTEWLQKFFLETENRPENPQAKISENDENTMRNLSESGAKTSFGNSGQNNPVRENVSADIEKMSDRNHIGHIKDIDELKGQRREEILKIVKISTNGATISDIRSSSSRSLRDCGEKTLQRELVSMVHEGVLKKEGEKRWSRYFVNI